MDLVNSLFPSLLQLSPDASSNETVELLIVGLFAILLVVTIFTMLAMRKSVEELTRVVRRTPGDINEAITDARQVADELRSLTNRSRPDDDAPVRSARRPKPDRERAERPERPERSERPERTERVGAPDRVDGAEAAPQNEADRERKRRRKRRSSREGRERSRGDQAPAGGGESAGDVGASSAPEAQPASD